MKVRQGSTDFEIIAKSTHSVSINEKKRTEVSEAGKNSILQCHYPTKYGD